MCSHTPHPHITPHLQGPKGFPDVFNNFQKTFAAGYKGKGNEVRHGFNPYTCCTAAALQPPSLMLYQMHQCCHIRAFLM